MKTIPSPLAGKSIMVVDDEPELRKAVGNEFRRRNCIVVEAGSGNEALQEFRKQKIDVVVSDVRMPGGTGVDLLESLRKLDPNVPLIFLITGFTDLTPEDARERGANGILEKPIDRQHLISMVESCIKPAR